MAYLPEEKGWGPGVFKIETDTPWVGGLEGNCNKQALEFIKRLNYLKDFADEIAAARGGKANLDARLDQYDAFNPDSIAALYMFTAMGIDLAGLANREAAKTIRQRLQSGVAVVTNRGIISGCTVSKSANAVRNLSLAAGAFFLNGLEISCPAVPNGALVPANDGSAAQICYAYIFLNANGQAQFATTPFGQAVPAGGLALYRITVPAGNTGENDSYLGSVTLTDVRRVEAGYPIQVNSLPYASVALPYSMIDSDYAVYLDILNFKGGGNQRTMVYPGDKASNGFKIYVQGSLDAVNVRWTAVKLSL
ncbi:MAG: hypothetical protein LBL20_00170 [Treponema sp.]|jgi:hypothetical protein|nr:hypothetical protein [Treponema sp.]